MIAYVGVTVLAALSAWLIALTMPRGPVTASQALAVMVSCLMVGLIAGAITRSRWTMVLLPIVHIAILEIMRLNLAGPTVGAIRFDGMFSILSMILGRGFYLLVGVIPLEFGASLGIALARLSSGLDAPSRFGVWRWTPAAIMALALIALAVWILLPASTPAILGTDGKPLKGSVAELTTVKLGGIDQAIMIRGYSTEKPVLLYLSGGPGQSDLPFSRVLFADLTKDFVVVGWDQRGTGKSYAALEPSSKLTLEQAVLDTLELSNYLRNRFKEQKIYLMGGSWGSVLGVLAVQRQPALFHAFIGSGQMVNLRETDRRAYHDVLALARKNNDTKLEATMKAYGEPPYSDPIANATVLGLYDQLYKPYTPPQAYRGLGTKANLGFYGVLGSEYNLVEKVNALRGLIDVFSIMYPQLQGIDFRRDASRLEIPYYMLDGAAEMTSRRDLALEWFAKLEAPKKQKFTFENSAHSVAFEQFEAFHNIMLEVVVPQTHKAQR